MKTQNFFFTIILVSILSLFSCSKSEVFVQQEKDVMIEGGKMAFKNDEAFESFIKQIKENNESPFSKSEFYSLKHILADFSDEFIDQVCQEYSRSGKNTSKYFVFVQEKMRLT